MLEGAVSTPLNAHSRVSASTQLPALRQGKIRLEVSGTSQSYGLFMITGALVLLHLVARLAKKLREVPHEPHAHSAEASGEYYGRLL